MKRIAFFLSLICVIVGHTQVSIIGSFSNWNTDVVMNTTNNTNWTLTHTFNTSTLLKFRLNGSWDTNWGSNTFPGGTGVQGGPDIPVPAGVYNINFNSSNGVYFFELVEAIIEPFVNPKNRQVVLQGFWWDYYNANYNNGWANYLTELAPRLKAIGIDAVWIPPTIKNTGTNSVGYAPFDHYDLGDKWQKGNVKTRLGDKDELLRMMAVFKANGMDIIQDIVLNHITGAGSANGAGGIDPEAMDDGSTQRFKNFRYASFETPAVNQTAATYLALRGRFPKNWPNFYPNPGNLCCTNDINSPFWGPDISYESNAFGLSSNAIYNPPQGENYMRNGMRDWIIWYKKQMGWDGVRVDAVKHFPDFITEDYLWNLQNNAGWASGGEELFAVGELVDFNPFNLDAWCAAVQNRAGTFDFALRDGLHGIISGNGFYNLGNIPSTQQSNRSRTVPFVNNHDSFRPNFDENGNYISWGNALAPLIEPNDGRLSVVYAIMMAVDGAPQVFFEDLFDIGYNSNRWNHDPKNPEQLPMRSDIANIIWCHQNLHFKAGPYLVRWQAPDALVIERGGKALIAVTDSWNDWQNLNGVQTNFPDGTVLRDYSGANTNTTTVYGGGLANISIPPCNGSALQGRRGYSIWAPAGITDNYDRPALRITQEWEMANDLGDRHSNSLQQGGALPNNSDDCRLVGKIFVKANEEILVELFPENPELGINLFLQDENCNDLTSVTSNGPIVLNYTPNYSGWLNIKIQNATNTQAGQRVWVKVNYMAPAVVNTAIPKAKCACQFSGFTSIERQELGSVSVYPNPVKDILHIKNFTSENFLNAYQIWSTDGRIIDSGLLNNPSDPQIPVNGLSQGVYILHLRNSKTGEHVVVKFSKN
jgi:alpha-amylase